MNATIIREKIYEIRGQKVMLDFDLAELYGVETRSLNQAVKRNINRFPEDFMFRLTAEEWARRSQIVTASEFRNKGHLPYAFTEHGVTMLASVLRSEKAVNMSIAVVRAFIALKTYAIQQHALSDQLQDIRDRLGEHDVQLSNIYEAIENLLDNRAKRRLRTRRSEERRSAEVQAEQKTWEDRQRIGFKR